MSQATTAALNNLKKEVGDKSYFAALSHHYCWGGGRINRWRKAIQSNEMMAGSNDID